MSAFQIFNQKFTFLELIDAPSPSPYLHLHNGERVEVDACRLIRYTMNCCHFFLFIYKTSCQWYAFEVHCDLQKTECEFCGTRHHSDRCHFFDEYVDDIFEIIKSDKKFRLMALFELI